MFLNAVMLAGISAALLPIVLHLLGRSRSRRVEWGAMMFLEESTTSQLRSARLKQWLLLAFRAGLIALLAITLARPIATGGLRSLAESQPLAAVLVIDVSPSMAYPEPSGTRLEQAKRAALAILARLRKGDQAGLVRLGAMGDGADTPLSSDLQEVASQINALSIQSGAASVPDGVRRAQAMVQATSGFAREMYLLTDRQESTWRDALPKPDRSLRCTAILVGTNHSENVAIDSIDLVLKPVVAKCPADLLVKVRNYSSEPRNDVPLVLYMDDREIARTTVNLAADAAQTLRLPATFGEAGSHVVTAQISANDLPADDVAQKAIEVIDPLRVVLVSGATRDAVAKRQPGQFSGDVDFLELALAPGAIAQSGQPDAANVTVISRESWEDLDFAQTDVVMIANTPTFTPGQVRDLEQFVLAGGGVLLAPGLDANVREWTTLLYRDGTGLLPGELTASRGPYDPADRIVGVDVSSTVFRFSASRTDPIPNIAATRHFRLTRLASDAQVLASFQSGEPLLVQRPFGRGRVIVSTVPFDASASNIVFSNDFLPMVQSIAHELADASRLDRNIAPGTLIQARFNVPRDRKVTVTRPDGTTTALNLSADGAMSRLTYADTAQPGPYTFHIDKLPDLVYFASAPCVDSDLKPISKTSLREIGQRSGMAIIDDDPAQLEATVGSSRQSVEFTSPLLLVMLAWVTMELWLSQRWGAPQAEVSA